MSESLEMLKTEEGQLNAVFALFGSAAQHAQTFEEALGNFLLAYNKICNQSITLEDLDRKLQRMTMGQLLKEMKGFVKIDDANAVDRFDKALEARNFLIHKYFLERNEWFSTEAGRMALLTELSNIGTLLDNSRIMANAMRIAMCRTVGIEDIWFPKAKDNRSAD